MDMIFIDDRQGSKELADLVTDGILTHLKYGDAMFVGSGPDGDVDIGVERKTIGDLINSITTGRLSGHQLPGLLSHYYKVYLIVEGIHRAHPGDGELEVHVGSRWRNLDRGGRVFSYDAMWGYLSTLEVMTGVIVRSTDSIRATASMIESIYKWWQKEWKSHKGHLQMHKGGIPTAIMKPGKPSLIRRIAAELPAIGWGRSLEVEKRFGSVEEMVNAGEEEWTEIEGIGKVTAHQVWESLR